MNLAPPGRTKGIRDPDTVRPMFQLIGALDANLKHFGGRLALFGRAVRQAGHAQEVTFLHVAVLQLVLENGIPHDGSRADGVDGDQPLLSLVGARHATVDPFHHFPHPHRSRVATDDFETVIVHTYGRALALSIAFGHCSILLCRWFGFRSASYFFADLGYTKSLNTAGHTRVCCQSMYSAIAILEGHSAKVGHTHLVQRPRPLAPLPSLINFPDSRFANQVDVRKGSVKIVSDILARAKNRARGVDN